jgi:biotin synthase-related radical SAM superfamily protein
MKPSEWKNFVIGLIDGLEQQLRSSAPKTARLKLAELRECINKAVTAKKRKSWERRLDRLTESSSFFKAAARRHVGARMDVALDARERSIEGMIKLAQVRGNKVGARKITKLLADFRKKRRKPIYKPISDAKK